MVGQRSRRRPAEIRVHRGRFDGGEPFGHARLGGRRGARDLFGLGFAPKSDEAGTDAILDALQSLKPGEQTEAAASADESTDEGK